MKKIAILLVGLSLCFIAAGRGNLPLVRLGVKAGYTMQGYNIAETGNGGMAAELGGSHPGIQAGIATRLSIPRLPLHVQLEILYEHFKIGNGSSPYKFNTVSFPILAGVDFGIGKTGLRLLTGPSLTLMDKTTRGGKEELTANAILRRPAMWNFGAGVDIWKLTLDLRYGISMKRRSVSTGSGEIASIKNSSFWAVSVGILF